MAVPAPLALLQKALPVVAKQLPRLWPLLLEAKNRERVAGLAKDLAATTPTKRLGAKMELTEVLAETHAGQASTASERAQAEEWQHRAARMRIRLGMPVEGRQARRAHLASLHDDLAALHTEMSRALGEPTRGEL